MVQLSLKALFIPSGSYICIGAFNLRVLSLVQESSINVDYLSKKNVYPIYLILESFDYSSS